MGRGSVFRFRAIRQQRLPARPVMNCGLAHDKSAQAKRLQLSGISPFGIYAKFHDGGRRAMGVELTLPRQPGQGR